MLDLARRDARAVDRRHLVLLCLRGGGPRRQRAVGVVARAARAAGRGRRHPRRAHRRAGRGRLPGHHAGAGDAARACGPTRPARSPGATPSIASAPLLDAVAGWRGPDRRPRRVHLRRAAPGGRGRRGSGGERRPRRGQRHAELPLRPRPQSWPMRRRTCADLLERVVRARTRATAGARRRRPTARRPRLDHPLLAALVDDDRAPRPRAKVGWTDVASFWEHGVPAANFGPGDPLLAHHPDEHVTRAQLERARAVLAALIA